MNTQVTIDSAGRIIIPKSVRDELRIEPGDALELESENMAMTLRPVRSVSPLKKERGIWVFRSGNKITADESAKFLKDIREQRNHLNRNKDK